MKQYYYSFLMAIMAFFVVEATAISDELGSQDNLTEEQIKEIVNELIPCNSNQGTEFYFSFPPAFEQGGQGNALVLYISSRVETRVEVRVPGTGVIKTKKTVPNDIISIILSPAEGQPFNKSGNQAAPAKEVYSQQGIHVIANDPIICYAVTRFRFTSDGFLAIPVAGLGTEYIISSYSDMSAMYPGFNLPSETTITAAFDDTKVFVTLGGNPFTRTTNGMRTQEQRAITLPRAGDVLALSTNGSESDLSGTYIRSTKPVAVVSGNQCANVPTIIRWCDYISEADLPMHTWGKEYHVTKIKDRVQNSWIKVYAKEENTTVYLNDRVMGTISTRGGQEGVGFIHRQVEAGPASSHVVWSDKPIYVVQYNPGQELDGVSTDPWQLVLTPLEQYQKEITFNTPGVAQLRFTQNYVNLVYKLDENGLVPEDLEFAKVENGEFEWRRVKDLYGSSPGDVFSRDVEGSKYGMKILQLPGDGVYKIRAKEAFAAYAYGQEDFDTYGFPTSVALGDLTKSDDEEPPEVTYEVECDGSVGLHGDKKATVRDMPENSEIRSNLGAIFMVKEYSCNYKLEVEEFIPGTSPETNWSLEVIDKNINGRAVVVFADRNCNFTTIVVTYEAFNVELKEELTDFGLVKVGGNKDMEVQLINKNPTGPVTIGYVQLQSQVDGINSGFSIISPAAGDFPLVLAANDGSNEDYFTTITVRFNAEEAGEFEDEILVGNDCHETKAKVIAKSGAPEIIVADHDFGAVLVTRESTKSLEVRNTGTTALKFFRVVDDQGNDLDPTGESDVLGGIFKITWPNEYILDENYTLGPGETFQFKVTFTPADVTAYHAEIFFESEAGTITDNVSILDGVGIKGGLLVTTSFWERERKNEGPYGGGEIVIENPTPASEGGAAITIKGISVLTAENVAPAGVDVEQTFNAATIRNHNAGGIATFGGSKTLNPEEKITIAATFDPQDIDLHTIVFGIEYDDGSGDDLEPARAILSGTGIQGVLTSGVVDFGRMLVNDDANPNSNIDPVYFEAVAGPFNDDVVITGFTSDNINSQPAGSEFSDPNDLAAVGASLNGTPVTSFPITLGIGERLIFDSPTFVAREVGNRLMRVSANSNAHDNSQATDVDWIGEGFSDGIGVFVGTIERICAGSQTNFEITIRNDGEGNIDVTNIALLNAANPNFSVGDVVLEDGSIVSPDTDFQLGAGQEAKVIMTYTPMDANSHGGTLVVSNSTRNNSEATVEFSASAFDYSVGSELTAAGAVSGVARISPGEKLNVDLNIQGNIPAEAEIEALSVVISYDSEILKPLLDEISVNGVQGTFDASFDPTNEANHIFETAPDREELRLLITVPSGSLSNDNLLQITFRSFLANYRKHDYSTAMTANIDVIGSQCARVAPAEGDAGLEAVCALDFRGVTFVGISYGISQNTPNPASNKTTINYNVGLEAPTSLKLYNAMGEVVKTLVDQTLSAGTYTATVETADLPAGTYFYKYESGPFSETRNMVIAR